MKNYRKITLLKKKDTEIPKPKKIAFSLDQTSKLSKEDEEEC